jgi:hypothetical protein
MTFLLPAHAPHPVLQPARHVIECIPERDVHVFVLHAAHGQIITRQCDLDADGDRPAPQPVLVSQLDGDVAVHDGGMAALQLGCFFPCSGSYGP